jgi:hypothetical protein
MATVSAGHDKEGVMRTSRPSPTEVQRVGQNCLGLDATVAVASRA